MAKATFKCQNCQRLLTVNFQLGKKIPVPQCLCGCQMSRVFNTQGLGEAVSDQMIGISQSFLYR